MKYIRSAIFGLLALSLFPALVAAQSLPSPSYKSVTTSTAKFPGSTSGTTILQPSAAASGTLTLPASTDTLIGRDTADTITNKHMLLGNLLGENDALSSVQSGQSLTTYSSTGTLGPIYGQIVASFTGGSGGDSSATVVGAVRGYNQVSPSVGYWVGTGGLFVNDNLSWLAQGVGASLQGNSWRGGRAWGATLEGIEKPESFCTPTASGSACQAIAVGATSLTVANGFVSATETVIANGTQLTYGSGFTETGCSGSAPVLCTGVSLATGISAGQKGFIYRGDPRQAIIGVEVDATGGPGIDNQNTQTGNRIGVAIFGVQDNTASYTTPTHIGSLLALFTNPNVSADRGISFSGAGNVYNGKNGIDFNNTAFTGNAIFMPGLLANHQNIGIGDTSNTFGLQMSGTSTTMGNGVGFQFRDTTSTTIDLRAFASSAFSSGNIGTWSNHDLALWRNAGPVVRLYASAMAPNTDNVYGLGSSTVRWASIYGITYFAGTGNVAGVSCSGTPTASFASVGGIVTHC